MWQSISKRREKSTREMVRIAAFPFISSRDSLEVAWLTHSLSSRPVCLVTCTSAVLCHPPRDSNARGMKATPCLWQSSAAPLIFLSNAKSRLWPGVVAASTTVACCSGLRREQHLFPQPSLGERYQPASCRSQAKGNDPPSLGLAQLRQPSGTHGPGLNCAW